MPNLSKMKGLQVFEKGDGARRRNDATSENQAFGSVQPTGLTDGSPPSPDGAASNHFSRLPGAKLNEIDASTRDYDGNDLPEYAELLWPIHAGELRALLTEIRELRAENARLKKLTIPTWFYHPDYPEYCKFDPSEVIDEDYDPLPGDHVFEIDCAAALPSIWCAVHVSNDPDADERFTHTEHASEAEARAALGEPQ